MTGLYSEAEWFNKACTVGRVLMSFMNDNLGGDASSTLSVLERIREGR